MEQHIGFCVTSDGKRIAYAVAGAGPPLVLTAPWVTHLELDWETPRYAPTWKRWRVTAPSCAMTAMAAASPTATAPISPWARMSDHWQWSETMLSHHEPCKP